MANQWNKFKGFWSRLVEHKELSGPYQTRPSAEQRRFNIENQIVALRQETDNVKRGIELDCDLWKRDTAISYNVRQSLLRARDLRYKGSLLRLELKRSFPTSEYATEEVLKTNSRNEPPAKVREVARRILRNGHFTQKTERASFEMAMRDLLGPSLEKQRAAIKLLGKLELPQLAPLFRAALAFDDDMLQADCLQALVRLNESNALQELSGCLESPSYKLRLTALRGLYNLKSPGAGSACLQCLADWNPEVRKSAATFLGLQKSRATAPALAVLLRDEAVEVRVAAARALETFCSEQTVYMLIRALEDEDISVRTAVKAALSRTLSVPLDIDVHQEPDILFPKVETLLQWWSNARAEGLPWSIPDLLGCTEPHFVGK